MVAATDPHAADLDGIEEWFIRSLRREAWRVRIATLIRRYLLLILIAAMPLVYIADHAYGWHFSHKFLSALCIVTWAITGLVLFWRRRRGYTPRRSLPVKLALIREYLAQRDHRLTGELFLAHRQSMRVPEAYRYASLNDAVSASRVLPLHAIVRETYPPLPMRTLEKWMLAQPRPWDYDAYIRHLECALRTVYPDYPAAPMPANSGFNDELKDKFDEYVYRPIHTYYKFKNPDEEANALPDMDALRINLRRADFSIMQRMAEAEWIARRIDDDPARFFDLRLVRRQCELRREMDLIEELPRDITLSIARGGDVIETRLISPMEIWWILHDALNYFRDPNKEIKRTLVQNEDEYLPRYTHLHFEPGKHVTFEWSDTPITETTVRWKDPEPPPPPPKLEDPAAHPIPWTEWIRFYPLCRILWGILMFHVAVIFCGLIVLFRYPVLDSDQLIVHSFFYSVPLWLIYSVLYVCATVFDKSNPPIEAGPAMRMLGISVLSSVPWILSVVVLFFWFNAALDPGKESVHRARVIHTTHTKYTESLSVPSWRPGRETENIPVSMSISYRAEKNTPVEITTKPGRLGYEWVVSTTKILTPPQQRD